MPGRLSSSTKFHHFTENSWKLLQVQLRKKWEPVANVNPVGEIWWRPLELKKFQKWVKFWGGSQRIPITFAIVTATSLGTVGYLNTWLPRSIFIYTSNTLLTAGCCKSELRYLKHWHRLLCPGLVKPILGHSFGRSWYMRLFHTPSRSFLLTTRPWKHNSCSGFIFILGKNLRASLEPFWIPLCVSVHKRTSHNMKSKHLWKISVASPCRSFCSYLLAVGDVREYCVLSNHCHIQILDISHDLQNGFVSGLPSSSPLPPPPPPPHLKSPLP